MKRAHQHIGSTFESFLVEEGLYEDATRHALERVCAWADRRNDERAEDPRQRNGTTDQEGPEAARV